MKLANLEFNEGPKCRVRGVVASGMKDDGIGNLNITWKTELGQFVRSPTCFTAYARACASARAEGLVVGRAASMPNEDREASGTSNAQPNKSVQKILPIYE